MNFEGTFELADVSTEEVWLALSDPAMIRRALPGCQFLVAVDEADPDFDELAAEASDDVPETLPDADPEDVSDRAISEGQRYATMIQVGVGSVKPKFETLVTIDRREFPEMEASGEGRASDSSFEMNSGMTLTETDGGVEVAWWANADVFGRLVQMGQRVIDPVANHAVNRFFGRIEEQLGDVDTDSTSLRDRVNDLFT